MRKLFLPGLVVLVTLAILSRLFYLQILDDDYKLMAQNNAIKIKYEYPERGYIYDRKGRLLVSNQASYDLMIVPNEVKELDTLEFCTLVGVTKSFFDQQLQKAITYERRLPSVFLSQLSSDDFSRFNEKFRKFPGFYVQKRYLRRYHVNTSGNVFGFITQVNQKIIDENKYYKLGDLIGKQGVEEQYEEVLRGKKGVRFIQRDKFNREIGPYKDGIFDTLPVQGRDINLSIDMDLQEYGEKLMENKWGGIVAIEPASGEILALVSAPSYDPSLLVGRKRSKNYTKLYNDSIAQPLFDRGLLAQYPPGSPFKILTGLIGLQEKIIDTSTAFSCRNGASFGRKFQKCHDVGTFSLNAAIYKSCNTYFGRTYCNIVDKNNQQAKNVENWKRHLLSFGLGQFIGIDMPIGKKGNIPASNLYDKVYNKSWTGATIRSNAIGQGEVLMTPIQLCNMMAAVANEGFYYVPHIVKKIEGKAIEKNFREKKITTIDKKYFKPVKKGLWDVYNYGTAGRLQSKEVLIAGKTGTAENYKKIGGKRVKLKDHSIFVAFAPIENPKIAIAVFIENGGFGATVAGPIATCMVEKYLLNKITRKDLEDRVLQKSLLGEYAKLYPRKVYDSIARSHNVPFDSIQKFQQRIYDSVKSNLP